MKMYICWSGSEHVYEITRQCSLHSVFVWNHWAMCITRWCLDLWKTRSEKNTVAAPLWSLRVYSQTFSASLRWKCTQRRQISNLCWHKVTPDDARISNKTGDWLCWSAKAAPAPQWILGMEANTLLLLMVCNRRLISMKLAVTALIWRSEI